MSQYFANSEFLNLYVQVYSVYIKINCIGNSFTAILHILLIFYMKYGFSNILYTHYTWWHQWRVRLMTNGRTSVCYFVITDTFVIPAPTSIYNTITINNKNRMEKILKKIVTKNQFFSKSFIVPTKFFISAETLWNNEEYVVLHLSIQFGLFE